MLSVSFPAAVMTLLACNVVLVSSFHCSVPLVGRVNSLPSWAPRSSKKTELLVASDYENDDFVNERAYYRDDSFSVAGESVPGHKVLIPRKGPRPPPSRRPNTSFPEPRAGFMDDRPFPPSERVGDAFRVGGRPVEGHQVIRPRRGPRPPTARGDHMWVTTSNPNFVRTDQSYSEPPFDEFDGGYGPRDGISRGGNPFRPNSQDLMGRGRMPMQDEEWDRYRFSKAPGTPFRPMSGPDSWSNPMRSRRGMNNYGRYMDDIRFSSTQGREDMPHFLTDDETGLPVGGDRLPPRDRPPREFELLDDDGPRGADRMSAREKEWMELEDRRRRRRPRAAPQDLRGVGRMPMRGRDWDDYRYPGRRGRPRRPADFEDYGPPDEYDSGLPRDVVREGYPREPPYARHGRRDDFGDRRRDFPRGEFPEDMPPPPPPPPEEIRDSRDAMDFDDDYVRDGPYMVRSGLPSYREPPPPPPPMSREEEEECRRGFDRRGGDAFYEDARYFDDRPRRYFSRRDEPRDEMMRERGQEMFNADRRDRPGSMGGPMEEELMGVDTRYTSTRQDWRAGTSYDTV